MSERQYSTFRKGSFTDSHVKVHAYLNQLGVSYKAEEVVHTGFFDGKDRPISYKVDVLVNDLRYGVGVIEVEGKGSNTSDNQTRDYILLHTLPNIIFNNFRILWIEHLPNKEVSLLAVSDILARHRH